MMTRIALSVLVRDFGATLICLCSSIENIISVIQINLPDSLPLTIWQPPSLVVLQRVIKFMKLIDPGSIFYSLRVSSKLVHPVGWP